MLVYLATTGVQDKLTDQLKEQINFAEKDAWLNAVIFMKQSYPYENLSNLTIKQRAEIFKEISKMSQEPVIQFLKNFPDAIDSIIQFWLFNGIYIRANKRIIEELAKRNDVLYISHILETKPVPIIEEKEDKILTNEWNIQIIMADSCWDAGYTGDSIILGMIDTGIDTTHPALRGGKLIKWRDFVYNLPEPYDDEGHGTACAGIICGGDGLGPFTDDVGVAPSSKLVVAGVYSGGGPYIDPILALQWMACLKSDSGFNIRAINNGWGRLNIWRALQTLIGINERESDTKCTVMVRIAPNPFRNATMIKFQSALGGPNPKSQGNSKSQTPNHSAIRNLQSEIPLKIYDATGRIVKSFNHLTIQPFNQVVWSGDDDLGRKLPEGVYFVRLKVGDDKKVGKAVLLR